MQRERKSTGAGEWAGAGFGARTGAAASRRRDVRAGGFTLMELLVVIAVILLVTLIAIPNFTGMRMQADETSAIESLRSVYQGQVAYAAKFPTVGFACSLASLGGGRTGVATPEQARVIEAKLAAGTKSGYRFSIMSCHNDGYIRPLKAGETAPYIRYVAIAVPVVPGKTGRRGFCIDQTGELTADLGGGSDCTQSVQ
jgi:type IV pilus assembly protein PilA